MSGYAEPRQSGRSQNHNICKKINPHISQILDVLVSIHIVACQAAFVKIGQALVPSFYVLDYKSVSTSCFVYATCRSGLVHLFTD